MWPFNTEHNQDLCIYALRGHGRYLISQSYFRKEADDIYSVTDPETKPQSCKFIIRTD